MQKWSIKYLLDLTSGWVKFKFSQHVSRNFDDFEFTVLKLPIQVSMSVGH